MTINFWRDVKQRAQVLREIVLPGAIILGLVILVRLSGLLQVQEWMALDSLSRSCPVEHQESSVLIVGINEVDLRFVGGFPVPDRDLAIALQNLLAHHPSTIGLDLFRNLPVEPGHAALAQTLQNAPNLIGVEVVLTKTAVVKPPPGLSSERVGFADMIVDADGKLRRSLLASSPALGSELKYSLPFRLAQMHLATRGIPFKPDEHSSSPLRFGSTELPRFQANSGGYVHAKAGGNQLLLNFCGTSKTVRSLAFKDVLQQNFDPGWIRDHVVIIGMTASSIKDIFFTSALQETLNSEATQLQIPANQAIYRVEAHAYTVHQIINAVLRHHPLITSWADPWEYLWIGAWGCLGLAVGVVLQSPWRSLLSLGIASLFLTMLCHMLLRTMGWWLPLVPALLALCGCGLSASFFDRNLRFELEYRRLAIERTYEAVHNGPLQHLAVILRSLGADEEHSSNRLERQLWVLNEELRRIFEHMRQEVSTKYTRLYLRGDLVLDLKAPIAELLYQVYNHTRAEQLPGLTTVRTFVPPNFEPLQVGRYSLEQRRGLCLFLHEALFNVGKHADGATRLDVVCTVEAGWYVLRVIDNGPGFNASAQLREGQGTLQARAIARELGGHFFRRSNYPHGTICELTWRQQNNWHRWLRFNLLPKSASPMP